MAAHDIDGLWCDTPPGSQNWRQATEQTRAFLAEAKQVQHQLTLSGMGYLPQLIVSVKKVYPLVTARTIEQVACGEITAQEAAAGVYRKDAASGVTYTLAPPGNEFDGFAFLPVGYGGFKPQGASAAVVGNVVPEVPNSSADITVDKLAGTLKQLQNKWNLTSNPQWPNYISNSWSGKWSENGSAIEKEHVHCPDDNRKLEVTRQPWGDRWQCTKTDCRQIFWGESAEVHQPPGVRRDAVEELNQVMRWLTRQGLDGRPHVVPTCLAHVLHFHDGASANIGRLEPREVLYVLKATAQTLREKWGSMRGAGRIEGAAERVRTRELPELPQPKQERLARATLALALRRLDHWCDITGRSSQFKNIYRPDPSGLSTKQCLAYLSCIWAACHERGVKELADAMVDHLGDVTEADVSKLIDQYGYGVEEAAGRLIVLEDAQPQANGQPARVRRQMYLED